MKDDDDRCSPNGKDLADALVDYAMFCQIAKGHLNGGKIEGREKLASLERASMVVVPCQTMIYVSRMAIELAFVDILHLGSHDDYDSCYDLVVGSYSQPGGLPPQEEKGKIVSAMRRAYEASALHLVEHVLFDPLWMSTYEGREKECLELGQLVTDSGSKIVAVAGYECRARIEVSDLCSDGNWEVADHCTFSLPTFILLEYMRRHPSDLSPVGIGLGMRTRVKRIMKEMSPNLQPKIPKAVYALSVDDNELAHIVREIVLKETPVETTPRPRIAVIGGDNRILRQPWPTHLDIRPYVADDTQRVVESARAGRVDAVVALTKWMGHSGYEKLMNQKVAPVICWKRGIPELAKAMFSVTSVADMEATFRQADGSPLSTNGTTATPSVEAKVPKDQKAPNLSPAMMTWGKSIIDALEKSGGEAHINDIRHDLEIDDGSSDSVEYTKEVQVVLDAMVASGQVMSDGLGCYQLAAGHKDEESVEAVEAEDKEEIEEPAAPEETKTMPQPAPTPPALVPAPTTTTVKAANPKQRLPFLLTWTDRKGDHQERQVAQADAPDMMSGMLSGDDPHVDTKTVRLWKEVKVRVRVEFE